MIEYVPCVLDCPAGGMAEGEPPLVDDYEDQHNGGCNSYNWDYPFQDLFGDADGELIFCGVSGWYDYHGASYRDTDWFRVYAGDAGVVEVDGDAEVPTYLFDLGIHDCNTPAVIQNILVGECVSGTMTMVYPPGHDIWFWAGPTTFESPGPAVGNEYDYVVHFTGLMPQPVATEAHSWSSVKGLFR